MAVSIAQRFNGDIINADALQIYEGLPIATNKIPDRERGGVPHHLLGGIGLDKPPWTVGDFCARASDTIAKIRAQGKVPIVVGGTHYYTQALLFRDGTLEQEKECANVMSVEEQEKQWPILGSRTEEMLEALRNVDPKMALRWHPRDRRKIRRSLEIWLQTGRKASEVYEEQQRQKLSDGAESILQGPEDLSQLPSPLLYQTLTLYVHASRASLQPRLDDRVDSMLSAGLLSEIDSLYSLHQSLVSQNAFVDTTRGIWVAIGYKEFAPYLFALQSENPPDGSTLEKLKEECTEKTRTATRQYAKRQVRWIRLKLLPALRDAGAGSKCFLLDGSHVANWSAAVESVAYGLVRAFLAGEDLPRPSSMNEVAAEMLKDMESNEVRVDMGLFARTCNVCGTTLMSEREMELHLKSRKHKGLLKKSQLNSASLQDVYKSPKLEELESNKSDPS